MTAPTPEQMRALAVRLRTEQPPRQELEAALRTAADQLEAVHAYAIGVRLRDESISAELIALVTTGSAFLTADTAPQEKTMTHASNCATIDPAGMYDNVDDCDCTAPQGDRDE